MTDSKKAAFSLDVEDGVSLAMFHDFGVPCKQTNRVVIYTNQILDLLDEHNVKGTFFVLGQVAVEFPELVKEIDKRGHELGVHGFNHYQFFKMSEDQAFEEISRAKKLIEDITGQQIQGHRAPAFSITPETKWGLDMIAKAGFTYDSSIMPIKGRRYGWPGFNQDIKRIRLSSGNELIEVPLSVTSLLGRKIPVGGGGYLRLFPYSFTKWSFNRISVDRPPILYMHPYELDTERYPDYYFEQLNNLSVKKRLRMKSMWWNRSTVYSKLDKLLGEFNFCTIQEMIKEQLPG